MFSPSWPAVLVSAYASFAEPFSSDIGLVRLCIDCLNHLTDGRVDRVTDCHRGDITATNRQRFGGINFLGSHLIVGAGH